MKKIKELFNRPLPWVLIVAFLTLTAQIGYVRVRGTGTVGTPACWATSNTIDTCASGEAVDGSGSANKVPKWSDANTLTDSVITDSGTNVTVVPIGNFTVTSAQTSFDVDSSVITVTYNAATAGNGGTYMTSTVDAAVAADGSDTYTIANIAQTNTPNHTGTGNTTNVLSLTGKTDVNTNLNGINIANITGTTGAAGEVEAAIKIGTGWDVDLLLTGSGIIDGDITLGTNDVDDIVFNGPTTLEVYREDFDGPGVVVHDITNGDFAASVADTEANMLFFGGGNQTGGLYYRNEQAFGGTYAPGTFLNGGVFLISSTSLLDVTDNDGIEFVVGGAPVTGAGGLGVVFDEDSSETAYCEVSFTITTIANVTTDDFYFGIFLNEAIIDAFAVNGADTYAMFILSDNAGDLDIESELNGGGTLNDDTGTTWANGNTKVLRVQISSDDVDFYLDGAQVTQTNAVLNADDGDTMVCRFGLRSSGTTAGVTVNYIELGRLQ